MSEVDVPGTSLVLTPPAAVQVVAPTQVEGMLPVAADRRSQLSSTAQGFVRDLVGLTPNSPEMTTKVDEIARLGATEMTASAGSTNRMLERPASALATTSAGGDGGSAQGKTAKSLNELRLMVVELTPNRADLEGRPARRLLGIIPGGNKIQAYFDRYKSAQTQLDEITRSLAASQDELRKDNAAIEQERTNLWTLMGAMTEYTLLLGEVDQALEQRVTELDATSPETARAMRSDVLFVVRQRRQDIVTQLAVAAQSYLAMDMVKKNNVELLKGVERARTSTLAALRTAVITAEALTNQKLVLNQIQALNATTSEVIANNAAMLRTQSGEIQQQAANTTIDIAKLEQAFADVFATMDSIDTFRAQAVDAMRATTSSLEQQLSLAAPYLERSHATGGASIQGPPA